MQYQNLILFALLAAVFWFLVIRPQQQRQKQHVEMLDELAAGDEIVTIGGIYATVVEVGDRVRIALVDGAQLEVARQAVAQIVEKAGPDEGAATESESETDDNTIDVADDAADEDADA